ncbi:Rossmann-like alpha/beta/alpha sandwich fold [Abortiporus biennis]
MSPIFETQLANIRRGLSSVELVYTSHDRWPLSTRSTTTSRPSSFPGGSGGGGSPRLNVSILDSSFNPPTLAHLALANTSYPSSFRTPSSISTTNGSSHSHDHHFHAKLLLLSVRNADKVLKPSDATYPQRLEMMRLFTSSIKPDTIPGNPDHQHQQHLHDPNVAVAIIDEPTFVGKSQILLDFLRKRLSSVDVDGGEGNMTTTTTTSIKDWDPKLTFLLGVDTLERLFSPRYYLSPEVMERSLNHFLSPEGDDSHIICARRVTPGSEEHDAERERNAIAQAQSFFDSNRITMVDIDKDVVAFSSSEVRNAIAKRNDSSWTRMLTPPVAKYVSEQHLYQDLYTV